MGRQREMDEWEQRANDGAGPQPAVWLDPYRGVGTSALRKALAPGVELDDADALQQLGSGGPDPLKTIGPQNGKSNIGQVRRYRRKLVANLQ